MVRPRASNVNFNQDVALAQRVNDATYNAIRAHDAEANNRGIKSERELAVLSDGSLGNAAAYHPLRAALLEIEFIDNQAVDELPSIKDATGFSWFILDDDRLIGQADLPSLETKGLTASEVESLPPRDTLIYVYATSNGTVTPVEIDDTFRRPFHITEASDGYVTLQPFFDLGQLGAKILQIPSP